MSLSKQQYRAMKIAGAAAIFSALTFEKFYKILIDQILMIFCSKPSKSYQFRLFFQNFIKTLIDFANFKILILQFKFI